MADIGIRAFFQMYAPDLVPSLRSGVGRQLGWEPVRPHSVRWLFQHGFYPLILLFEGSPRNADGWPEVTEGETVTLDWRVAPRGAHDVIVSLSAQDANGNDLWRRQGLPLTGQSTESPHPTTKQYVLWATSPSQGAWGHQSRPLPVVVHPKPAPPPPPPTGSELYMINLWHEPLFPAENEPIQVTAVYGNAGPDASPAFEVLLQVDDGENLPASQATMPARTQGQAVWQLPGLQAGAYTITVILDPNGAVNDPNRDDNTFSQAFPVGV